MNEKILIEGLKARNKEVFDFVFTYYYSGLCAFALNYIPNPQVVEDIVQDFFVRLWSKGGTLEIKGSIKAYCFTAIKNQCLDHIKHQKVEQDFLTTNRRYVLTEDSACPDFYVEAELKEIIQKGLDVLPARCREIFILNRFKGRTNQEIADTLHLSKGTVELQISNALKLLRKELKEYLICTVLFLILALS